LGTPSLPTRVSKNFKKIPPALSSSPKEKNLLNLYQLGHKEPKFWLVFSAPFYPGENGRPNS
jgi:hypothetical protein